MRGPRHRIPPHATCASSPGARSTTTTRRDLDQLSVAERLPNGATRMLVAIADVDALVRKGSAIDRRAGAEHHLGLHRRQDLPDAPGAPLDRPDVAGPGRGPARGRDRAGGRADGRWRGPRSTARRCAITPSSPTTRRGVAGRLRRRHPPARRRARPRGEPALAGRRRAAAARLCGTSTARSISRRSRRGRYSTARRSATSSSGQEPRPRADRRPDDRVEWRHGALSRATTACRPAPRAALAGALGADRRRREPSSASELPGRARLGRARDLPAASESSADPLRFPDLSLTIVKLMGSGEYAVDVPGREPIGHFGLAVRDYTHSTAPNRRYPDVITQRMLKAALAGAPAAYSLAELDDAGAPLHRAGGRRDQGRAAGAQVGCCAAARGPDRRALPGHRHGRVREGHLGAPPRAAGRGQGRAAAGKGLDVGDRVEVKLLGTDVERGFIDFARVGR